VLRGKQRERRRARARLGLPGGVMGVLGIGHTLWYRLEGERGAIARIARPCSRACLGRSLFFSKSKQTKRGNVAYVSLNFI
jgi:hypothetical protein